MTTKWMSRGILLLAVCCFMLGCSAKNESSSSKRKILVTTGFVGDFVRNVGADFFEIEQLMGSGVDPHLYKATARDLERLLRADLVVYHGLHLEGRLAEVLEQAKTQGRKTYAVAEALDKEKLLVADESMAGGKTYDPHVWMDARLWSGALPALAAELARLSPEHEKVLRERAETYQTELETLHTWVQSEVGRLPVAKRILVTSHDAFRYFGRAYGIEVQPLQGISTVSEVSLRTLMDLSAVLKAKSIKVLFVESSVSPKAVEQLSRQLGAKIGGELYSDALGMPGQRRLDFEVGTYTGMLKYNVKTFVQSMGENP